MCIGVRVLDPLELQMSIDSCELGTEAWSSGREAIVLLTTEPPLQPQLFNALYYTVTFGRQPCGSLICPDGKYLTFSI